MATRDNFGKPFGQNFYNYEWFIGDRTSIVSYGWFEFWKVGGDPYLNYNTSLDKNDPFGLHIITSGLLDHPDPQGEHLHRLLGRQHRADQHLGPRTLQYSYWLSPKWFGTVAESYDFGNGLLLGGDRLVDQDRGRLPDLGRPGGQPAPAQLSCSRSSRSPRG